MTFTKSQLLCEQGKLNILWEGTPIEIAFDFQDDKHKIFYKAIRELQKEVESLKNRAIQDENNIDDKFAKIILRELISTKKGEKVISISVIDLHNNTNLPLEQINRIMTQLEEEGIVMEKDNEW